MKLYQQKNTLTERRIKADKAADSKVPEGLWVRCPKCRQLLAKAQIDDYGDCPNCGAGMRISARQRLKWLVDDFAEFDQDLHTNNPLHFPNYVEKLEKMEKAAHLNDAVLTGRAQIGEVSFNLGIMDPTVIMGSLGTVTGEKITRLFEDASKHRLPVVLFTASGGARMQEGILSLMQMQKISNAIYEHSQLGLLYLTVLTDPTTGGVTASFAMDGDIILAEPHAMVGFAGRRVIEQTMHTKIPQDLQDAETVLSHGFIDKIVERKDEKALLAKLIKVGGPND